MQRRLIPVLAIFLIAATSAHAQYGGGGGGGRGGGSQTPPTTSAPSAPVPPPPPPKPVSSIEIVGEIKALDPENSRMTIAYEAVEALNWPVGVMPFLVEKAALFKGVTVGEKVRFKLAEQQISEIAPY